jgi:hypothetical protein
LIRDSVANTTHGYRVSLSGILPFTIEFAAIATRSAGSCGSRQLGSAQGLGWVDGGTITLSLLVINQYNVIT